MIDGRNFLITDLKNNNIWKISSGEGDDYTTGCLLH